MAIDFRSKDREELGKTLDFVKTDQPAAVRVEEELRLVELGHVASILKIEIDGIRLGHESMSQGRLAALPRTEQGHNRRSPKRLNEIIHGETGNISVHFTTL